MAKNHYNKPYNDPQKAPDTVSNWNFVMLGHRMFCTLTFLSYFFSTEFFLTQICFEVIKCYMKKLTKNAVISSA